MLGQFLRATQQGDLLGAETAARAAVKIFPRDANWHYNVACVCARDNRPDEALDWLDKAIVRGFSDMRALEQDDDLTSIRGTERFRERTGRYIAAVGEAVERHSKTMENLWKDFLGSMKGE